VIDYVIAPSARRDIAEILAWTEENFGVLAMERYQKLIGSAIKDIAENPNRLGSVSRPEIAKSCRTYHLFYSRKRAARAGAKVRKPRHFLLFRMTEQGALEIGRVLHDSMDLTEQIPEEYVR